LATDDEYHYLGDGGWTPEGDVYPVPANVAAALAAAGCKVYIDPTAGFASWYDGTNTFSPGVDLAVGGSIEAPLSLGTYTFPDLVGATTP
jgi:hypothetical protein